jgi:hypothetical protein
MILCCFALMACQTDQQLTSVNPVLQSSESRDLRQKISGSTATFPGDDSEIARNCTISYAFARNGSLLRKVNCRSLLQDSVYFTKIAGGGGTQSAEGSWTIRDNQLCYNIFRINGYETNETMRKAVCLNVKFNNNRVLFYENNEFIEATITRS